MKVFRRNAKMRVAPGSTVDPDGELRAQLAAANERNRLVRDELEQIDAALEALKKRHASMLASNTMFRRQNENLRVEKAGVLGRLSAADRHIVELGAENADLKFDLEQAREREQRSERLAEALRAELDAVKKTAAAGVEALVEVPAQPAIQTPFPGQTQGKMLA